MASSLVIAIGTTGLAILEQTQRFYYEYTGQTSPSDTKFLFIETDVNRTAARLTNGKTAITPCNMQFNNILNSLQQWNQQKKWDWLPNNAQVLNAGNGAGGRPTYGRIALWANYSSIMQTINMAYAQINGNQNTNIYVLGTLTGGTGSGMFIDIAYIIRHITGNNNIYGMFMLPNKINVGNGIVQGMYENALNSIKALNKYWKADVKTGKNYVCTMPNGTVLDSPYSPYKKVEFLTTDFVNGNAALVDLNSLIHSAAMAFVLKMFKDPNNKFPLPDTISRRFIDQDQNVKELPYTTIGMHIFQYPEAMLNEYFATELAEKEVLKRWSDPDNFINTHGIITPILTIANNQIPNEARKFVESAVKNAIEACQGQSVMGANSMKDSFMQEILKIKTKAYLGSAGSPQDYVSKLFNPNVPANYFTIINGFSTSLRDSFIEELHDFIETKARQYKNIHVIKLYLGEIVKAMNNLMADWKNRLKINGQINQITTTLGAALEERASKTSEINFSIYGYKGEYWYEVFEDLAQMCYLNTFVQIFQNVTININNNAEIRTTQGILLPNLASCNAIIAMLGKLLNGQEPMSVTMRKNNIRGQLTTSHNQFHYLYNVSFDDDVKNMWNNYNMRGQKFGFDVIGWDYLLSTDIQQIKDDVIKSGLTFVDAANLLQTKNGVAVDIVQLMKREVDNPKHPCNKLLNTIFNGNDAALQQLTPGMVSLVSPLGFDKSRLFMQVIAPYANNDAHGIAVQMSGYNVAPANDTYIQIPDLKNTVVLYQQYGMINDEEFNPEKHVEYQAQVQNGIDMRKQNGTYDAVLSEPYR